MQGQFHYRVKHLPDCVTWLVDGCHKRLLVCRSNILQVAHDTEGRKAVKACNSSHTYTHTVSFCLKAVQGRERGCQGAV